MQNKEEFKQDLSISEIDRLKEVQDAIEKSVELEEKCRAKLSKIEIERNQCDRARLFIVTEILNERELEQEKKLEKHNEEIARLEKESRSIVNAIKKYLGFAKKAVYNPNKTITEIKKSFLEEFIESDSIKDQKKVDELQEFENRMRDAQKPVRELQNERKMLVDKLYDRVTEMMGILSNTIVVIGNMNKSLQIVMEDNAAIKAGMKEMQEAQKRSEEAQKKSEAKIDLLLELFRNNHSNSFVDMVNTQRSNSKDRGRE